MTLAFDLQRFADGERSEPATPKRRQEARRRGQVARSMDLSMALVALAGALLLRATAPMLVGDAARLSAGYWSGRFTTQELSFDVLRLMAYEGLHAFRGVGLLASGIMVAGLAAQIAQVGFLSSGTPLTPQLSRLNPIAGLGRMFSSKALVELVRSSLKAAVVAWSAYAFIRDLVTQSDRLVMTEPFHAAGQIGMLAYQQLVRMGLVLLAIGLADYAYQRWELEQSLRMSRHEVLDEFKQAEGDPHVRGRIRSRMRQIAMQRMMHAAARATVVVTNPTHVAVALRYEQEEMDAPVVVAKGQDQLARRIVEVATGKGVPVVENPPLAWALYDAVDVGRPISPELYRAVAEVLAYVYRLRHATGSHRRGVRGRTPSPGPGVPEARVPE